MAWTASNSEGFDAPVALAVDVVVLAAGKPDGVRLLVMHSDDVDRLVGGLLLPTESAEAGVRRVLKDKAGIQDLGLEQLAAFTDPARDPRGWIPTIAHLALVCADDVSLDPGIGWLAAGEWNRLAYDHAKIAAAGIDRVRGKLWWSNVAAKLLPKEFTLSEARAVYEAIAQRDYDPSTFGRDLLATGLIVPTGKSRSMPRGRPARTFRFTSEQPEWGAGRRKRIA